MNKSLILIGFLLLGVSSGCASNQPNQIEEKDVSLIDDYIFPYSSNGPVFEIFTNEFNNEIQIRFEKIDKNIVKVTFFPDFSKSPDDYNEYVFQFTDGIKRILKRTDSNLNVTNHSYEINNFTSDYYKISNNSVSYFETLENSLSKTDRTIELISMEQLNDNSMDTLQLTYRIFTVFFDGNQADVTMTRETYIRDKGFTRLEVMEDDRWKTILSTRQ